MSNFRIPSALLALALANPLLSTRDLTAQPSPPETSAKTNVSSSLKVAITLPNAQTNGVAIAPGGRTFMVIAKQKGQDVPQLAEYKSGRRVPYPDAGWNSWKPGNDASHAWVHANSVRFGPDGTLWVVDFGSPGLGQADVKLWNIANGTTTIKVSARRSRSHASSSEKIAKRHVSAVKWNISYDGITFVP